MKLCTLFHDENSKKRKLFQIAFNQSSYIRFDDFMKIYKKYANICYSRLGNNPTPPSNDPFKFLKELTKTSLFY